MLCVSLLLLPVFAEAVRGWGGKQPVRLKRMCDTIRTCYEAVVAVVNALQEILGTLRTINEEDRAADRSKRTIGASSILC
jgi:hypothetical protein